MSSKRRASSASSLAGDEATVRADEPLASVGEDCESDCSCTASRSPAWLEGAAEEELALLELEDELVATDEADCSVSVGGGTAA